MREDLIYFAHGLRIRSDVALPYRRATGASVDVVIRLGRVDPPPTATRGGYAVRSDSGDVYVGCEGAGRIQIRSGAAIIIEPAKGADEGVLQEMLGPALGVLLRQRGMLVLHGSAVLMRNTVVAFLGAPGAGKSTTAAALHARGHGVVADDVIALQTDVSVPRVVASCPRLHLWTDAVAALGHRPSLLPRLHRQVEKYALATDGSGAESHVLGRIYLLATGLRTQVEPLQPGDAFVELLRHSYGARVLQNAAPGVHFHQCARLLATVPVSRLTVCPSLSELRSLAHLVEQHAVSRDTHCG